MRTFGQPWATPTVIKALRRALADLRGQDREAYLAVTAEEGAPAQSPAYERGIAFLKEALS